MHIETLVIVPVTAQLIPAPWKKNQDDMRRIGRAQRLNRAGDLLRYRYAPLRPPVPEGSAQISQPGIPGSGISIGNP